MLSGHVTFGFWSLRFYLGNIFFVFKRIRNQEPKLMPFFAGKHFGDIHSEHDTFMKRPLDKYFANDN